MMSEPPFAAAAAACRCSDGTAAKRIESCSAQYALADLGTNASYIVAFGPEQESQLITRPSCLLGLLWSLIDAVS